MKTQQFIIAMTMLGLLSCTPTMQYNVEKALNPLEAKMEEAMAGWGAVKVAKGEPDREADGTWLNVGIRYKYALLKQYTSIEALETITGEKVFLSGPHTATKLNYDSPDDFGHYNPAFLLSVKRSIQVAMKHEVFNTAAQKFYNNELKNMARIYHRAYQYVKEKGGKSAFELQATFDDYGSEEEKAGYDWYVASTAPSFWVRRFNDGTAENFNEILELVIKKYDADFLKS